MGLLVDFLERTAPFERGELHAILATAPLRYKVYKIPKRGGRGSRTIAHPAPEVKLLQRVLVERVLHKLPVHTAAVGYRAGKSIADHAKPHLDSAYLLKLDFKDFFPSIKANDVREHATRHLSFLSREDIVLLANLLCWKSRPNDWQLTLSVGAPSSPLVSNSVMYEFDQDISTRCLSAGIAYTRYADDLAFSTSTPQKLSDVVSWVQEQLNTLAYPRLSLNTAKTTNVSKKYRRSLVGLVLTPDRRLSLGRDRKRLIHTQLYRCVLGKLSAAEVSSLRGTLAFAWGVEPTFIHTLLRKYGSAPMELLGLPFRPEDEPSS